MNVSCAHGELDESDAGNLTETFWDIVQEEPKDFTPIILHLLIFFTGIPLNSWIILGILFHKLYHQPTYLLLLNLAVSDLLICFIPVLLNIISNFLGYYSFGASDFIRCHACKIAVVYIILNFQTVFNLALLSLDRLMFFKLSIKYHHTVSTRRVGAVLGAVWLLSILLGIPPLLGFGDIVFAMVCGPIFVTRAHLEQSIPYIVVGIFVHTAVIVVVVVSNIWIVRIGLRHIRTLRVKPTPKTTGGYFERRLSHIDVESTIKQFKLFQVFGVILLVHFVTIIPAIVLVGILMSSQSDVPKGLLKFVKVSLIAQATLHPLVEAFFTPELKKMAKMMCCNCRGRRISNASTIYEDNSGANNTPRTSY